MPYKIDKSVLRHLKKDAKTWGAIEREAREEKMSDLREIKRLKKR